MPAAPSRISPNANWNLIPDYMRDGLTLYIDHGYPPGHFLTAVLSNDLREATARADATNQQALANYVIFLFNYAPSGCWGSPEKVRDWIRTNSVHQMLKAESPDV